ncbi:hypothetical protein [Streptomyces sp. SP2-10]|uniref:hypothetical protein n=1 Tax=Streptomyces sp. SP2-10 TaxID=2873385 RepID=UPI00223C12F9|nr:hypothetical protein [Streptomyces sp. SP2-10]
MTSIAQTPVTGLDLTGFTPREPGVWTDAAGLVLSVHFFPVVPDLPAPLHEEERLRRENARAAAGSGGGLIEAVVGSVDGVPALRQLIKMPLQSRRGQAFIGSWTLPKDRCSTVVKVQAAEGATTGWREAVVMNEVGPDHFFRPHPYAGGEQFGGLPYHVADLEQWDSPFPEHPLTLVRAALHRLTPTVTVHEQFRALPAFTGPAPSPDRPGPSAAPYGGPPSPAHPGPAHPPPPGPAAPPHPGPTPPPHPSPPPAPHPGATPPPHPGGPVPPPASRRGWFRGRGA